MRVTGAKAFGSGTHVTDLADLATGDEPMLSDVLAAQREGLAASQQANGKAPTRWKPHARTKVE